MGIQGIEYGHEHERIEHLLRTVDRPGDYCVGGRLYTPMPRVVVDGAGELSFPIPDAQIRALIAAAERAPYGKGTETLVDTSVRDCWQIDATRVRVTGRAWPDSFAKVMDLVAAGLGLPAERLGAELYKLLVYRPGGFFAEHRDTEKVPGMVATLSLSLPTPGAGGALVVRHGGREEVIDLNAGEPSELSFAAFYADCLHEVRPLAEGHRVTLVFNLFLGSSGDAPGAPDYSNLARPVAECLGRCRDEGVTDKLVWLLDHEYSEGGLSFDTLWPVGEDDWRKQDRAAMLRLLHGTGEAEPAADFLHRVVMANYDGAENEALAAILPVIGPEGAGEFLPWFVEEHLPRRFRDVVEVLVLAAVECTGGPSARDVVDPALDAAWGEVLREAAATALSGLRAAFRTESEMRPGEDDDWPPGTRLRLPARSGRAAQDKWIDHATVCGLLALAHRLGLDVEAASAAEAIGDHPDIVTPDRMLPAALELMHKQGALADTAAYGELWRLAADLLLERSSTVPVEPTNWTIAADIPCKCEFCNKLHAFCEDPVKRLEHFKVRKDLRKHLHQVIDRRRLDLHHVTARRGSPYTLVCTKNRASHKRRLDEYAEDLRRMDSLLNCAPDRKTRGTPEGRVVRLARALRVAGSERGMGYRQYTTVSLST